MLAEKGSRRRVRTILTDVEPVQMGSGNAHVNLVTPMSTKLATGIVYCMASCAGEAGSVHGFGKFS